MRTKKKYLKKALNGVLERLKILLSKLLIKILSLKNYVKKN